MGTVIHNQQPTMVQSTLSLVMPYKFGVAKIKLQNIY